MGIGERLRRMVPGGSKANGTVNGAKSNGAHQRAPVESFIASRRAAIAHLSDADLDRITEGSVAALDPREVDQIKRDAQANREQLKNARSEPGAHPQT